LLARSEEAIRQRIRSRLQTIGILEPGEIGFLTQRRLDALLVEVVNAQKVVMGEIVEMLADDLIDIGEYEAGFLNRALRKSVPGAIALQEFIASPELLESIINSKPFQGHLLGTHFRRLAQINSRATRAMRKAIEEGLVLGDSIDAIIRRIDRKSLRLTRANVRATVHTAISHVTRNMQDRWGQDNQDVVKGYQWLATLDLQTCDQCASRDGFLYNLQFEPIDGGPPWLGGPGNLHWNDRCVSTLVLKSWKELGIDAQELDGRVRASLDGQVKKAPNYIDWISGQSNARKERYFGPRRMELLNTGKITERDLFDFNDGDLWTLAELKEKEKFAGLFD
jgi:hypothetical protein